MKVRFTTSANRELVEAVDYYESQQPGLGGRFLDEVDAAVDRIRQHPDTWAKVSDRVRRCLVHRFPFAVLYQHLESEVHVLAVADMRRDPRRWERLL